MSFHSWRKSLSNKKYIWWNRHQVAHGAWQPPVMSLTETMDYIIEHRSSVTRFGDGELRLMLGEDISKFQKPSPELSRELQAALRAREDGLLICLPSSFGDLGEFNLHAEIFWSRLWSHYRKKVRPLFKNDHYVYGSANISRFYMDYIHKDHIPGILAKWRQIFRGKQIYIIEGELSRLGVGNDLFAGAASLHRILGPAKNAFSSYKKILEFVSSHVPVAEDTLILLALGPTATVLVPHLSRLGYQAIDTGHIDVEYSWYKMGTAKKVPLQGKYVNEAGGFISELPAGSLKDYQSQIMGRIDC